MRGSVRGRNNKNEARGSNRVGLACAGASLWGASLLGPSLLAGAVLGASVWPLGSAQAQIGAPGGMVTAPAGAFTTPLGAYGAPPAIAPPPAAPAAEASEETAPPAIPPAWLLTPSITLGESYTDNVNLAPPGAEVADFVTTISPGLKLTGQTSRLTLALDYHPQELLFARSSPSNVLQQRLLGTGKVELWRQALFVEGSASIDQAYIRNTGPIAPTTLTTNNNLQTVYAETVSPYLLQHLGSYADSESRYRFSSVSTSGNTIAAERTNELRQSFFGGEFFGRLGWSMIGDVTKLERQQSASDPFSGTSGKDTLLRVDLKYPVYQALSVIGGVGYERITDPTLLDQPKGVIWNVGLSYQPNQLVSASLTYGERFDRSDIEFSAAYNLDPQLRVSAIYTQTIQTGQSQIAGNLNNLITVNGVLVDARTGLAVNPTTVNPANTPFGLSSGAFIAKTAEIDAVLTKQRNTYGATVYQTKRTGSSAFTTFGATPVTASSVSAERVYGGTLGWTHQLQPSLASTAGATYYRAMFLDGSGRHDNAYTLSLALTYTLSRTATATLSLSRTDLQSNIPSNSLVDDIVMATIRKEF